MESLGTGAERGKGGFFPFYLFTFLPFYLFTLLPLLVVVRLSFYDSTCAIERLGKDKAHHLMREGHLGEGDLLVGAVVDWLRKAVGTADDKDKPSCRGLLALYPFGKLDASEFLSMFIHQHHGIRRLEELQNHFSFPVLLLLFAETLGVLEFRNGCYIERHVMGDALSIILDARNEMLVYGLSDQNEFCLHFLNHILLLTHKL